MVRAAQAAFEGRFPLSRTLIETAHAIGRRGGNDAADMMAIQTVDGLPEVETAVRRFVEHGPFLARGWLALILLAMDRTEETVRRRGQAAGLLGDVDTGRLAQGSARLTVGGDHWQFGEVVAKHGNLPAAEAEDLHERHRRALAVGFVERDVDLGDEHVGIRGVVQDGGGPFQVHRGLVGRLLVVRAGSGADRITAYQVPQRMALGSQRRVVHAILSEHRGDRLRVAGDRTGIDVPFEDFLMGKSHSPV